MKQGTDIKQLMIALRPQIDAALVPIAKTHGLKALKLGRGTYSPGGHFTFKLEGVTEGGLDKEAELYTQATFLGLPPLGSEFRNGPHTYKTDGLNATGTKVLCKRVGTDDRYLYTVDVVKALVARQSKEPA